MSIRWKIALLCITLSVLPMIFLNRYALREFDRFTRQEQEDRMIGYASVVADEYARHTATGTFNNQAFSDRLRIYEARFGTRLQIVSADGSVIHDSAADAATGRNALDDPEIRRALDGHYGARSALTSDRRLMYYYIALPVKNENGETMAAVRAIAHTRDITRAIQSMRGSFNQAQWLTLALAATAAILLSLTITRRLRRLTHSANSFARGDSLMPSTRYGRDEVGELGCAFEKLAAELSRNAKRQGNLLASTVHELKTPLTSIQGAVQLLRDEGAMNDPEARRKFLGNIQVSSDRLLRMVEQLAALSKLDAEELRGRKDRIRYGRFINEMLERLFPSPPVPISVSVPEEDPVVSIIPARIEQVLSNLIDNALRYTPSDGQISVTVRTVSSGVETVVQDTGSGIEPSDLPHVFDQFFTTVPKGHATEHGSGLGLTIAQSIVQNHDGHITVQSRPGQGATFTVFLPA
jgi:two-component system sensor histidine kinase ChvG